MRTRVSVLLSRRWTFADQDAGGGLRTKHTLEEVSVWTGGARYNPQRIMMQSVLWEWVAQGDEMTASVSTRRDGLTAGWMARVRALGQHHRQDKYEATIETGFNREGI